MMIGNIQLLKHSFALYFSIHCHPEEHHDCKSGNATKGAFFSACPPLVHIKTCLPADKVKKVTEDSPPTKLLSSNNNFFVADNNLWLLMLLRMTA
ncbi:MAG: hypothetical protein U1C70_02730 [Sediminibacterium sp.]|uniref:hypothetical protein n=1 Tax=Sediminibacterium sp. TaxID=1917865 RepID=UPI002ABAD19F|nr:hypothetical protein [Sediminibacterium sp.]MDZ4070716.1 hypothetical protein [Sediminibacterium sp.]